MIFILLYNINKGVSFSINNINLIYLGIYIVEIHKWNQVLIFVLILKRLES